MGTRGPKPLPDNVHLLNGNPSKKRLAVMHDGSRVPVEIPDCPSHLSASAKKEWKRISVELERLGLIAKIDRAALGVYCQAYARWETAEKKMRAAGDDALIYKMPSGYEQTSAWLQISNRSVEIMHKFLAEFGMTPSARSRVNVTVQQDLFNEPSTATPQPPTNPASKFFRSR
jgi:P27 family predicted phage terminase small subunit